MFIYNARVIPAGNLRPTGQNFILSGQNFFIKRTRISREQQIFKAVQLQQKTILMSGKNLIRPISLLMLAGLAVFLISWVVSSWKIAEDTEADFYIKDKMGKVHGTFDFKDSKITFDPDHPEKGQMDVTMDVGTIKTGIGMRDKHLRSDDFFEAEKYPTMKFHSTKISKTDSAYMVVGDLTIKDVTKSVSIPFHFAKQPNGNGLFTGDFVLNRVDYHVGESKKGGMGDDVRVSLKVPVVPEK
jgi:polyisoprenoid-binding protein YceI